MVFCPVVTGRLSYFAFVKGLPSSAAKLQTVADSRGANFETSLSFTSSGVFTLVLIARKLITMTSLGVGEFMDVSWSLPSDFDRDP